MSTSAVSSATPAVQRASWLPDCSQFDSLTEKYSSSWQTNLLIVGVVGAVASAVGAFFLNMAAFGVAFVALASILAYGAYCAHNTNQQRATLEQTVTELREQKQKLETDKNTLTATAARLQRQFADAQSTVSTLQANAGNLESRNSTLTVTGNNLRGEVDTLKHDQVNLQQRITQLQSAIPLLKNQIAAFADQNVKLGKDLSIADIETIKTDPLVDELKGSDPHVQELGQQIQRAKAVSAKLFSTFDGQRKMHLQQLQALTASHGSLADLEKKLQAQMLTLTNVQQQINARAEELKNINEKSAQAQLSLESKTREIAAEQAKLNAIVEDFNIAERGLEAARKELLTLTPKQEDLNLLNEKLLKTQTTFEDTQKSLREEARKLDQLKNELTLTQTEVEVAKTELLAYPQKLEELTKLSEELGKAQAFFKETKRVCNEETTKLEQIKLEAYAAQADLTAAQADLTAAQNELAAHAEKQAELKKLYEELGQVQSILSDTKKASDAEKLKLDELDANCAAKQAELDAILENIRNGTDLVQKKNSNLELRQAEKFQKAQKELAAVNSQIDLRKAELERLNKADTSLT